MTLALWLRLCRAVLLSIEFLARRNDLTVGQTIVFGGLPYLAAEQRSGCSLLLRRLAPSDPHPPFVCGFAALRGRLPTVGNLRNPLRVPFGPGPAGRKTRLLARGVATRLTQNPTASRARNLGPAGVDARATVAPKTGRVGQSRRVRLSRAPPTYTKNKTTSGIERITRPYLHNGWRVSSACPHPLFDESLTRPDLGKTDHSEAAVMYGILHSVDFGPIQANSKSTVVTR